MDATMIREAGAGAHAYRFTHALIADALYAAMDPAARIARHRRIAQLIERRRPSDRVAREAVARHWRGAGDRVRASAAYVQGALAAIEVFARADAVGFARIAAELAVDDAARFAALRIAAEVPARSDEREGWENDLEQLLAVAERLDDAQRFEAMALWEAFCWHSGRPEASAAALEQLSAIAARMSSPQERAIALERRSRVDLGAGRLSAAMECAREAFAIARGGADAIVLGRLRALISSIALRLGAHDESAAMLRMQREALAGGGTILERLDLLRAESMLAVATQDGDLAQRTGGALLDLARIAGDRENEALANIMLAYGAHERYDAARAREHYATAEAICRQVGRLPMLVSTTTNRGIFEADIGNHARALELWDAIAPQAEALSMRTTIGYQFVHRSAIAFLEGDNELATRAAQTARDLGEATSERRLFAEALVAFGAALAAGDDLDRAIETLERACTELRACGAERLLPEAQAFLIEALLRAGRVADASVHAAALRAYLREHANIHERHPARLALALAHEAEGRGDAEAAEAERAAGLQLLTARLAALGDDAGAYANLPFNRELQRGARALR